MPAWPKRRQKRKRRKKPQRPQQWQRLQPQRRHRRLPPRVLPRKRPPRSLPLRFDRLRRRPDRMIANELAEALSESGERTRPRVLAMTPSSSRTLSEDFRRGAENGTRGRVRSPELCSRSRRFIALVLVAL